MKPPKTTSMETSGIMELKPSILPRLLSSPLSVSQALYAASLAVEPKNGTDFSLEELQKIVGGYIEVLRLGSEQIMVLNEEGKLYGLGVNDKATVLAVTAGYADIIVGDVLVCPKEMVK